MFPRISPCFIFGDFTLKLFQRPPDQPAHHARRQSLRERMNRDDAIDVDEFIVAGFDEFRFRMLERARAERFRLTERQKLFARDIIILHPPLRLPPAQMEMRRAVIQHALEQTARSFAKSFFPSGNDLATHRHRFTDLQIADGEKLSAIFVTTRFVQQ